MNIAICDDQKASLKKIRQIVSDYVLSHSELSAEIRCFFQTLSICLTT
ncbi:MAG: hypothetical protein L6V93_10465 [Clostridiales bacterium]|nr:MAG: hypothetical protein L6V93_10465 [Clostridiales bacterium]